MDKPRLPNSKTWKARVVSSDDRKQKNAIKQLKGKPLWELSWHQQRAISLRRASATQKVAIVSKMRSTRQDRSYDSNLLAFVRILLWRRGKLLPLVRESSAILDGMGLLQHRTARNYRIQPCQATSLRDSIGASAGYCRYLITERERNFSI